MKNVLKSVKLRQRWFYAFLIRRGVFTQNIYVISKRLWKQGQQLHSCFAHVPTVQLLHTYNENYKIRDNFTAMARRLPAWPEIAEECIFPNQARTIDAFSMYFFEILYIWEGTCENCEKLDQMQWSVEWVFRKNVSLSRKLLTTKVFLFCFVSLFIL